MLIIAVATVFSDRKAWAANAETSRKNLQFTLQGTPEHRGLYLWYIISLYEDFQEDFQRSSRD